MRVRQVIGAWVAVVTISGCSLGSPEDAGTINLFVTAEPSTLPIGESMNIFVTARNVGFDALTLTGPSDCLLVVEVLTNQGQPLWSSTGGCTGSSVTETIDPGGEKLQTFVWNGSNLAGARLPSGFYLIRAIARLTEGAYVGPVVSVSLE